MKSMETLRNHHRVELVDDERTIGNGIIVTLKKGFTLDPMFDNRVGGADTVTEALGMVRRALKFDGPFDP